jgi:hypothetical protein
MMAGVTVAVITVIVRVIIRGWLEVFGLNLCVRGREEKT